MRISAEQHINYTNNSTIYDIIKAKRSQVSKPISLFSKISEKKKLLVEAQILLKESEKDSKLAYALLSDFKIEKENANIYQNKSENIKSFAKHEFVSAKKLLDETGQITKNEKKRRKDNNNSYVRVKKKKFAGGIEIDDYKNGELTRRVLQTGNTITVTAFDVEQNASIFSFDTDGNLLLYFDSVTTSKTKFQAKEKYIYSDGILSCIDLDYKKFGDGSEESKRHIVLSNNKPIEIYRGYKKFTNNETEISADENFLYSTKDNPYRYCKNYSISTNKEEASELEFKYDTSDFITYLKECKKCKQTENQQTKTLISRYKKRKLHAIYIQDNLTKSLRYFTFDLEGKPINYYEDTLES